MTVSRFFVEARSEISGNTLRGHAAVFDVMARIGPVYERVLRGAFDDALTRSDVRALVNHDPSQLLGRQSSGTLRIRPDTTGLGFEVDLPDTQAARDLRALVERGDLSGASFSFVAGDDRWSRAPDGLQLRTHTRFQTVRDVSPVTFPAYEETAVALRSVDFAAIDPRSQLIRLRAQGSRSPK